MLITWDESKRRTNLKKHGVDFAWLNEFFGNFCITREDLRFSYAERRFTGTGPFEGKILVAAFTYRRGGIHVISCRKATRREARDYYDSLAGR